MERAFPARKLSGTFVIPSEVFFFSRFYQNDQEITLPFVF